MKVRRKTHPEVFEALAHELSRFEMAFGFSVDDDDYLAFVKEAIVNHKHLGVPEIQAWAILNARSHHTVKRPFLWLRWAFRLLWIALGLLLLGKAVLGEPPSALRLPPLSTARLSHLLTLQEVTNLNGQAVNLSQIGGASISSALYDSGNTALKVNCVVGCSAAGAFTDNSAFTNASTSVTNVSGVFNDSITALTSGNAGALRSTSDRMLFVNIGKLGGTALSGANVVDSGNTAFRVNCVVGCGSSSFADNGAFTAGTTPVAITAGWFANSPTACTTGSACAPSLTSDRKLFVQSFQGTSPWVVSLASTTITGSVAVTGTFFQGTQPVSCASGATCPVNATIQNASIPVTQSGAWTDTVTQASGANLHVNVDSAPTTAVTGTFYQTIQPVSGSVAVTSGSVKIANTALQPVPVSNQTPIYVMFNNNGVLIPVQLIQGQATMSGSLPVVLASNQSAIPVTIPTVTGSGVDGQAHAMGTDGAGNQFFVPVGLPRQPCNAVRKTNCQP